MSTPPQNPWEQGGGPSDQYGQQVQYGQPGQWGQPGQYGQWEQPGQYGQWGQPYGCPQHQQPAGRYASWAKRFVAFLLDSLLVFPVYVVGFFVAGVASDSTGEFSGVGVVVLVLTVLVSWALQFWNRCMRAGRTGQSLGRQAMDVWLLEEATGRPMGTSRAFLRDLAHLLDGLCYVGYILAAFDAKTQTFADKIMKTVVVSR